MLKLRDFHHRYCEHNPNKAFASCSVAQELTNEEIDAESDSDGAGEVSKPESIP